MKLAIRGILTTLVVVAALWQALAPQPADAKSSPLFTVTGIKVDAREKNAAMARLKAISQAQVKGFKVLAARLGSPAAVKALSKLSPREIGAMMSSLSVEKERSGPGRYIATLTVRFLPDKVRAAFARAGLAITEQRAERIVVLPVWSGPDGNVVWRENPWRKAWLSLNAENGLVPVVIPLGDLNDQQAITAAEALSGDQPKLDAIKYRYDADAILVAAARPTAKNAMRAVLRGNSQLGAIAYDKTFRTRPGQTLDDVAVTAARTFYDRMTARWKKGNGAVAARSGNGAPQTMTISVPFASMAEWNNIRIELLTTPGVTGVDVNSISDSGAIVSLTYVVPLPSLQRSLRIARLNLALYGGQWVLQRY